MPNYFIELFRLYPKLSLIIVVFTAAIILLMFEDIRRRFVRKRAEKQFLEIKQILQNYGFSQGYNGKSIHFVPFEIMSQGTDRQREYQIDTSYRNGSLNLLKYSYYYERYGNRNQSTRRKFIVAIFDLPGSFLPQFILKPQDISELEINFSIGNPFTNPGIKFDNYPEFNRNYCLKSFDENAVRTLFKYNILESIAKRNQLCIESLDNSICIRSHVKYFHPKRILIFLEEVKTLIDLFYR